MSMAASKKKRKENERKNDLASRRRGPRRVGVVVVVVVVVVVGSSSLTNWEGTGYGRFRRRRRRRRPATFIDRGRLIDGWGGGCVGGLFGWGGRTVIVGIALTDEDLFAAGLWSDTIRVSSSSFSFSFSSFSFFLNLIIFFCSAPVLSWNRFHWGALWVFLRFFYFQMIFGSESVLSVKLWWWSDFFLKWFKSWNRFHWGEFFLRVVVDVFFPEMVSPVRLADEFHLLSRFSWRFYSFRGTFGVALGFSGFLLGLTRYDWT